MLKTYRVIEKVRGIGFDFESRKDCLEKVTEELRSQIIVIDLNLEALSKVSIDFEISSYGTVEDLENLLDINSNFISLKNSSDNRLIYKYIEI